MLKGLKFVYWCDGLIVEVSGVVDEFVIIFI